MFLPKPKKTALPTGVSGRRVRPMGHSPRSRPCRLVPWLIEFTVMLYILRTGYKEGNFYFPQWKKVLVFN